MRPHRRQPTRLSRLWDSPGKNTGVGCPFLLKCMKVKSESEVAQSCPTLRDPMDCSLPGSSVHGIFQARVLSGVPLPSPSPRICALYVVRTQHCVIHNHRFHFKILFDSWKTTLPKITFLILSNKHSSCLLQFMCLC